MKTSTSFSLVSFFWSHN